MIYYRLKGFKLLPLDFINSVKLLMAKDH